MLLCGLLASAALHAQGVQPGQRVPDFGDGDDIQRVDFNDLSGAVFDSARAVVLINTPLGVTQKIRVAVIARGRRVGIVQLNARGC